MNELLTVADNFPTDTSNRLVVSFRDRNGDITPGSYDDVLATGMAFSETSQISADEFALNKWDSDSDVVEVSLISSLSEALFFSDY